MSEAGHPDILRIVEEDDDVVDQQTLGIPIPEARAYGTLPTTFVLLDEGTCVGSDGLVHEHHAELGAPHTT
jgi:hypothetical protein